MPSFYKHTANLLQALCKLAASLIQAVFCKKMSICILIYRIIIFRDRYSTIKNIRIRIGIRFDIRI